MNLRKKLQLFGVFFFTTLITAYCTVHGFPGNLTELLIGMVAIFSLTILILLVFFVTSIVFGLPVYDILEQIKKS